MGVERPTTLFPWRNTDGSIKAVCLVIGLAASVDPGIACYDVANGSFYNDVNGTPGHPARMFPAQWFFVFWTGSPYVTDITDSEGTKSYIPFYNTATNATNATPARGATFCWNWTTQDACSGFKQPKYWHEINSGLNGDIGYFYDGSCMWGTGYGGKMWSFNAKTAETPCRVSRAKYTATLNLADFYCEGSNRQLRWGNLRLSKASMYDFQSFNVVVKDSSGTTVLKQANIKDDGTLDLSDIEYDEHSQLTVEVVSEVYSTSPWANGNLPFVTIVADAPDAQYCYDTVTKDYCDISEIRTSTNVNVVTDIDTLTGTTDTSIGLYQPDNEQCFKDVKVSVTRDKSQIAPGEDITYTAKVSSKANPNNFGRGNIEGAQIEMTIPSNFSLVSATAGGTLSGGKVVWQGQTINAGEFIERKITVRAPSSISSLRNAPRSNLVYAATTQIPLTVQAVVIADDDIFQVDNSSQDSSAVLVSTTPDPTPDPTPDQTLEGPGEPDPTPTTVEFPVTPDQPQNIAQPQLRQNRTPAALRKLLPFALIQPTENIFQAVYSAVSPISPTVASAIPYGTIAFLVAFACVYAYQAVQEARNRRRITTLTARAQQTEAMRRNYLDLTAHYLNTPIATMQNTVDLVKSIGRISQATAEAAKQRLARVSQHVQDLLSQSETLTIEAGNTKRAVEVSKTKFAFLTPGFLIPVFGVLMVTILLNLVFVWADKYSASVVSLGIQASYFVLSAIALAAAYNSFKRQKFATAIAEHELTLEKELSRAQSEFIANSGETLQNDIIELDQLVPAISAAPKGEIFESGLNSLKGAVSKLTYLNELTLRKNQPKITSDTVSELSKAVIAKYSKLAAEKNIEFRADIQPGLTARVDRDGYTQLLSSTLENAIMFNKPNGSVQLSISRYAQNAIKIVVMDTGKGISKDKIKSLFTPFARGTDTRQFDFEGFGLDLYMDRLIIEQAGGKITIDSEIGKGTTVTILLPS
ncbi:MAG: hypothetical protein KatS3mg087_1846 [Patescibacteria group bacterium]|nr:MAG: hypothetical protein KatS3mg087_1846 [Patescibacteria group bacterium]